VVRKVLFMAAVASATVFALSAVPVAGAWGDCSSGCGSATAVYIEPYADWVIVPGIVTLVVDFNCTPNAVPAGPDGSVEVTITQSADQSSNGEGSMGFGQSFVACNGSWRRVAISVMSGTFNLGCAEATATLTGGDGKTIATKRSIVIQPA
jgi:hypothetical protein